MRRGTVVLVPFPFTDLSGQKVRPALVLHAPKRSDDCIVVFISSREYKRLYPYDVSAPMSKQNGLKVDSVIRADKIATLHTKIVLGELGLLETNVLDAVSKKLKALFGL